MYSQSGRPQLGWAFWTVSRLLFESQSCVPEAMWVNGSDSTRQGRGRIDVGDGWDSRSEQRSRVTRNVVDLRHLLWWYMSYLTGMKSGEGLKESAKGRGRHSRKERHKSGRLCWKRRGAEIGEGQRQRSQKRVRHCCRTFFILGRDLLFSNYFSVEFCLNFAREDPSNRNGWWRSLLVKDASLRCVVHGWSPQTVSQMDQPELQGNRHLVLPQYGVIFEIQGKITKRGRG